MMKLPSAKGPLLKCACHECNIFVHECMPWESVEESGQALIVDHARAPL